MVPPPQIESPRVNCCQHGGQKGEVYSERRSLLTRSLTCAGAGAGAGVSSLSKAVVDLSEESEADGSGSLAGIEKRAGAGAPDEVEALSLVE